jgi:hypothetical protein
MNMFTVGQEVKIKSRGKMLPAKVTKVTKTTVCVDDYKGKNYEFTPKGNLRGDIWGTTSLRFLATGETYDGMVATIKEDTERKDREDALRRAEYKQAVDSWWEREGSYLLNHPEHKTEFDSSVVYLFKSKWMNGNALLLMTIHTDDSGGYVARAVGFGSGGNELETTGRAPTLKEALYLAIYEAQSKW